MKVHSPQQGGKESPHWAPAIAHVSWANAGVAVSRSMMAASVFIAKLVMMLALTCASKKIRTVGSSKLSCWAPAH